MFFWFVLDRIEGETSIGKASFVSETVSSIELSRLNFEGLSDPRSKLFSRNFSLLFSVAKSSCLMFKVGKMFSQHFFIICPLTPKSYCLSNFLFLYTKEEGLYAMDVRKPESIEFEVPHDKHFF